MYVNKVHKSHVESCFFLPWFSVYIDVIKLLFPTHEKWTRAHFRSGSHFLTERRNPQLTLPSSSQMSVVARGYCYFAYWIHKENANVLGHLWLLLLGAKCILPTITGVKWSLYWCVLDVVLNTHTMYNLYVFLNDIVS